jgi:hypothetical protein
MKSLMVKLEKYRDRAHEYSKRSTTKEECEGQGMENSLKEALRQEIQGYN